MLYVIGVIEKRKYKFEQARSIVVMTNSDKQTKNGFLTKERIMFRFSVPIPMPLAYRIIIGT